MLNFNSHDIDTASAGVATDDRLSAVARWDAGYSFVDGQGVRAYGLTQISGQVGFALRSGRQPATAAEIVLGPDTADRLGVHVGDTVAVAPQSESTSGASVTVVGIALFPDDGEAGFTDAVGYIGEAFERNAIAPDLFEAFQLVVRAAPGQDVDELLTSFDEEYPGSASSGENLPARPGRVANLADIRALPSWLAVFVAALGVASLCNVLLTTLRRRRVQLATLRSLGLTSRQIVSTMVCQALTITLLGLTIGIPLGIIAGRTSWFVVVDPIGVATDPTRSVLALVAVGRRCVVGRCVGRAGARLACRASPSGARYCGWSERVVAGRAGRSVLRARQPLRPAQGVIQRSGERDTLPGDVECRAVIDRGAHDRQADASR